MNRLLFAAAFLLGASAVLWMSSTFVGSDKLALSVTLVIGCVYTIGFIELLQFRKATATLSNALSTLPGQPTEAMTRLDPWLDQLHPSLQNSVRLRIEGERVGLPAPVITPYLVGLLVMLGLLGTFVGMVDTLSGAVLALEGTTELQAIRAGLAAPIQGLSLAFGTSVAGVAASAMLGLISTLSRRDRMLATRRLDSNITTVFRGFSLAYNRQETFKALQVQAQALPEVAQKLDAMADRLARMGDTLGDTLIASQNQFHQSATSLYSNLATSVDQSLKATLADSARQAAENIKPFVIDAMAAISKETQTTHQQLTLTAQQQLETLTARFSDTSTDVTLAWQTGLSAHERANEGLITRMSTSLESFNARVNSVSDALLASFEQSSTAWIARQAAGDQARLEQWSDSLGQAQQRAATQLIEASTAFTGELQQVTAIQQASFTTSVEHVEALSTSLTAQWQQAGERMDGLTATLGTELVTLRSEEERRGQVAVQRMETLTQQFSQTSTDVTQAWQAGLGAHVSANERLINGMSTSFESFNAHFNSISDTLLASFEQSSTAWIERQVAGDQARLEQWTDSLGQAQQQAATQLIDASTGFAGELQQVTTIQQASFSTTTAHVEAVSTSLTNLWLQAGERMDDFTTTLGTELVALRNDEERRGEAAVQRLASLEATVASHLATLGKALEDPMTRLIQTASETPRAAAEVIGHLRQEISNNIERDNNLLEERSRIMAQLHTLSGSLEQTTAAQRDAVDQLVSASTHTLQQVGSQFTEQLGTALARMSGVADNVAGSAIEMSSLGEAFGFAVTLFNESNGKLIEQLSRIEESMNQSVSRSDEQMGYYVAQAREIIDQTLLSQQEIFEELHQLNRKEECLPAVAN
jgi:hypothetical protein